MPRIVLVHWKPAEAVRRTASLVRAGFEVTLLTPTEGSVALRPLAATPPDAFVIDLSRLPSHGRAVATALRQQKGTRRVPLVFVGGEP
jgi:CheY-like chemotaxis protein